MSSDLWLGSGKGELEGGVKIAGQAGFMAPDKGFTVWITTAETAEREGCCCISGAAEFDFFDLITSALSGVHADERREEELEIAAYLRHVAGWLERGCNGRW